MLITSRNMVDETDWNCLEVLEMCQNHPSICLVYSGQLCPLWLQHNSPPGQTLHYGQMPTWEERACLDTALHLKGRRQPLLTHTGGGLGTIWGSDWCTGTGLVHTQLALGTHFSSLASTLLATGVKVLLPRTAHFEWIVSAWTWS